MIAAAPRIRAACRIARLLGSAIAALSLVAIVLASAWGGPVLAAGGSLFEKLFEALFAAVFLLTASAAAEAMIRTADCKADAGDSPAGTHGGELRRSAAVVLVLIVALASLRIVLIETLPSICRASVAKKFAYAGESDDAYSSAVYEFDRWYVRGPFKERVLETIPPGDSLAWVSDLRAHVPSAAFYPRRVYVLPELQRILNANAQTLWNDRDDPLHPDDPRFSGAPAGFADPGIREEFSAMIRERGIGWIVVYDALRPELCRIVRVNAAEGGAR